jgi:mycofactocin system glycosyltransferase
MSPQPAQPAPGQPPGLPIGTEVELDADTVIYPDGSVFGGSPGRLFRLNGRAAKGFAELRAGTVRTQDAATLGRRFTDVGLLHPRPATTARPDQAGTVTVVIPVRDRVAELDRCLAALGSSNTTVKTVLVVDDASRDPAALAEVVHRHGAELIRRPVNGGPGAARNTALENAETEFIAFCDSDCLPDPGWIDALLGHFDDPLVVAAAPRIVAAGDPPVTRADRFAHARPALDLGDRPARVAPMTRVSYLPTAALILRRKALENIKKPAGFDPALRYGEDVDLIWRLLESGGRIRYDPSVHVGHVEPHGWRALLTRRFAYGTSAAPLEDRHPGQVAPLILVAAPAATVAALLARRPLLAGLTFAAGYLEVARTLKRSGLPVKGITQPLARGVQETFFGAGRWTSQFAGPAALALMVMPFGSPRTKTARRAVIIALLTAPPIREWRRAQRAASSEATASKSPQLDVITWTAAVLADDIAYGAGVWSGSLKSRQLQAILPRWRRHLIGAIEKPRT